LRYSVAISGPLSGSYPAPFQGSFVEGIRWAGKLGFDAVELHLRSPDQVQAAELLAACGEVGLSVSAISTGMGYSVDGLSLIDDDPGRREAAACRLLGHIDLAGELGCSVIIGLMRGVIPDASRRQHYVDRFADSLDRLLSHAEKRKVSLLIEAINRFQTNYLLSVPETVQFIQRLHHHLLKLHIDTFHMNVEDRDMARAVHSSAEHLGYVHYSENNRGTPGGGQIDFRLLTSALLSANYRGYVALEFTPESDPTECTGACIRYLRSMEEVLERTRHS
jgi:sugar phosphate isomerase/epimerase